MTNKRVTFRVEAVVEIEDATQYYKVRNLDVATRFVREVRAIQKRISSNPRLYAFLHDPFRMAILHGFPYVLIYVEHDDYIDVIAVAHTSRKPLYWLERDA